jgi:hypothetical protein
MTADKARWSPPDVSYEAVHFLRRPLLYSRCEGDSAPALNSPNQLLLVMFKS